MQKTLHAKLYTVQRRVFSGRANALSTTKTTLESTLSHTSVPFTTKIAYLGNSDMKNFVLQKLCSAQNSAK